MVQSFNGWMSQVGQLMESERVTNSVIPVWAPKLWHPKNTVQVFFFQLYLAINDFTMHVIILNGLEDKNADRKGKQ